MEIIIGALLVIVLIANTITLGGVWLENMKRNQISVLLKDDFIKAIKKENDDVFKKEEK